MPQSSTAAEKESKLKKGAFSPFVGKKPSDQMVVCTSGSQNYQPFVDTNQILATLRDLFSGKNLSGVATSGRNNSELQFLAG